MELTELKEEDVDDKLANKLLLSYKEYNEELANIILVFGNRLTLKNRVEKAVELYKKGCARKILFSGGYTNGEEGSEAKLMHDLAISLGVCKEDILIEDKSLYTTENVIASMFVLEREFKLCNINRIIVVTTNLHIKRCELTLERYMTNWIKFFYCSDGFVENATEELKIQLKKKKIIEAKKLITYAKAGYINNCQI